MWSRKEALKEVELGVEDAILQNGGKISREWAAQFVINRHSSELRSTDSFAFFAMSEWIANAVREWLNEMTKKLPIPLPEQLQLDFPHLKWTYPIRRDDELISLSPVDCTDKELLDKASLYRTNAASLVAEADDIERYVKSRQAARRS